MSKKICKGCSTVVAKPVICKSCGVCSHPGSSCLAKSSHPWAVGALLDCQALPDMPVASGSSQDDSVLAALNSMQIYIRAELSSLSTKLDVTSARMEELYNSVNLKFEEFSSTLTDLSLRVSALEAHASADDVNGTSGCKCNVNDLAYEIQERQKKASNLILYDVPESSPPSIVTDILEVKKCLNLIVPDSYCNISIQRLGRYTLGKTRPVRVVFPSASTPLDILRKKSAYVGVIKIAPDRTVIERDHLRHLRDELKNFPDGSKMIKYVNGTPRIVNKIVGSKNGTAGRPSTTKT